MADLNQDILQVLRDIQRGMGGAGGGFRPPPSGPSGVGNVEKDLKELGQQAKDVEANIKLLNKQFLPFSGSLETARKLHGRMAQDLDSINEKLEFLDTALNENRVGNEKISAASRKAMEEEQKKLKAMKATVEFETTKRESVGNVFGALGGISDAYQKIAMTAVEGMASISSAIQQGGAGFNLLGAAAEHQANMAQAQANMGASAMASVGQSMQGLGLAGQVAGGALNFLAQQVQHNAELRRAAARIRNQLFMNMGEKFSQSFMAAAGAGAVFAGGATAMNAALEGSRITLSEFGELVKRNNSAFANSGISMEKLTRQVGATSAAFKKSGVDGQLMKLGLSFEQQADIIVETASEMNRLKIQAGGAGASQDEIAAAAEQSARNTAFMAQILGEEAKTREKANKEASAALAYKQKETEMAQKIGAGAAANQTKVIDQALPPELRKAFNQLLQFGTITDKDTAAAVEQNPAMKKMLFDLKGAYLAGNLQDAKSFGNIASRYSKDMQASAMGNKALANAALVSNNSTIQVGAKLGSEFSTMATQFSPEKLADAAGKSDQGKPGEPPPKADPLGDAIVNAAKTMNNFQKDMETYVVNNLPAWSSAMQAALAQMKDAYTGKVAGLNPLADKFAWLTEFMQKYGLIVMLAAQGMAILIAAAKLAAGGLAKIGAAGEMAKLKALADKKGPERYPAGTVIDGKKVGGQFKKSDSMEAPGGDIGKKGMFARGREALGTDDKNSKLFQMNQTKLAKVAGGAMVAMNVVSGVMNFMDGQKKYKEADQAGAEAKAFLEGPGKKSAADIQAAQNALAQAEEAKKQARADQGEGIGGAIGGAAGGAIGMMLGGPIGAAVGSYLGEMAGGALGKYIGPYWDDMSKKAGEMWDGTKKAVSAGWDSFSTGFSSVMSSMWKGIKEGWTWLKDMFSTIGKAIWNGIQQTPLFKLGSYIITGIAGAASGMATAMINGLKSAFDWMKTTIGNLIPDWMKNAASKVGNAVSNAYNYVTGNDTPKPPPPPPKPATAQPQPPPATTNKAATPQNKPTTPPPASTPAANKPPPTTATPGAAKPPEVNKSGAVSEKDIPKLLQESLKLMEYNAKGTERMVNILAAMNDYSKRTATATEKSARG